MEEILKRLRKMMFKEMNDKNYTISEASEICDMTYRGFCKIYYGETHDINLSTFVNICEKMHLSYFYILNDDTFENYILSFKLTNEKIAYSLIKNI